MLHLQVPLNGYEANEIISDTNETNDLQGEVADLPSLLVKNYLRMVIFALSRIRIERNSLRAFLFLLAAPLVYLLGPKDLMITQFGFFSVSSRYDVRSIVYGCFKASFAHLYNLRRLLPSRAHLKLVVDVGANTGDFSLGIRHLSEDIVAIEPSAHYAKMLRANLILNDVKNVSVLRVALHDKSEPVHLNGHRPNLYVESGDYGTETVAGQTLDSLLSNASRIDVVKVDAQGSEVRILEGMSSLIARNIVSLIAVEVHEKTGIASKDIIAFMQKLQYRCLFEDKYLFHQPHFYFVPSQQLSR